MGRVDKSPQALSPLFTVLSYAALFGVRYSSATYVALLPLTIGVMLACSFDLRANAVGFLCALGSTFIFVAQNIFSKKLLPKENHGAVSAEEKAGPSGGGGGGGTGAPGSAKLDKLNLLLYSSGMAFVLMVPIWLYSDASALFFSSSSASSSTSSSAVADESRTSTLVFYFFANGTVHFAQNLLAFSLLARTSPVTYSIASLVKRIAVICIAIVWSGQHVSFIQAVGMTSTFGGLWMYNRAKSDVDKGEKRRTQVEKRHDMSLPTTVADARDLDGRATPTPPPPGALPAGAYACGPTSPRAPAPPHAHGHAHAAPPSAYAPPQYTHSAAPSPHAPSASASTSAHGSPAGSLAPHPHSGAAARGGSSNGCSSASAAGGAAPTAGGAAGVGGGGGGGARNRTASASREPPRDRDRDRDRAASAVAAMEQWEKTHVAQSIPASLFGSPVSVGGGGGGGGGGEGGYR